MYRSLPAPVFPYIQSQALNMSTLRTSVDVRIPVSAECLLEQRFLQPGPPWLSVVPCLAARPATLSLHSSQGGL